MARKKTKKSTANEDGGIATSFKGMNINPDESTPPPRRNIAAEFARYFGNTDKLANWQRLCQDLGIEEELPSITKCRQALRGVWINIYDFIDAQRIGQQPRRFDTQHELARYTIETRRIYPKKKAKKGGPVRALLAHIFAR